MKQLLSKPFPYFVGVQTLEELVNKETRVCVINILGSESRKVTPVSHEYSGGNVVAGVQYGRKGSLDTKNGTIPVFRSIRDVMREGIEFDTGVIYLPPTAVSQAVSELILYNQKLKRIVIVTEKVAAKDSMMIRFMCQEAGVDVIGANCLGVANIWDHVRVGGALGGDKPDETLKPGSVAIHSNSGNFTTTISEYLRTAGFGISTAVSSGKDVYIHFALPEFLYAAQNDKRSKAVALYVEPGGYYEKTALSMIKAKEFEFNKPIVVCVTGRWKKDLTRSCGHAGALAGGGDDALAKESWFDEYFGVPCFDPENPVVSEKGVRIASIQDFPKAMKAVYEKIGEKTDFASSGDLSLKLWMSDNFFPVPKDLDLPVVKALAPYDKQILEINKHIGAQYLRQNMMDKSGASKMDPKTQVTALHGKSILDLSKLSVEENIYFSIAKILPEQKDINILNLLLNLLLKVDPERMDAVEYAKKNGASPNSYLASQILAIGNNFYIRQTKYYSKLIIDMIRENGIDEKTTEYPKEVIALIEKEILTSEKPEENSLGVYLLEGIKKFDSKNESVKLCKFIIEYAEKKNLHIKDKFEFILAALALSIFWKPMLEKRISRETAEDVLSYLYVIANLVALTVLDRKNNKFWQELTKMEPTNMTESFTANTFRILFNRDPKESELTELKYLIGLTLSNGPGTISAKGAKESVSARNHIPTCFAGFMVNTGFAHGGNGFEAVEYLLNNFKDQDLKNPGDKNLTFDLKAIANKAAITYREYVKEAKEAGKMSYTKIPCVNHPVFKGNDVNIDPREQFVSKELEAKNIYNVFLDFYHKLVVELFNEGATKNIFCVNVDAVISVIALKLVWEDYKTNKISANDIQELVFILFLIGRAVGVSAEIIDHRSRGTDMDCRTPQSQLTYVL
jgi:succinyl-CoA synthetase alpha subunit/citrate synthase